MRQLQQAHHCKGLKIQPQFGTCVVHVTSQDRQLLWPFLTTDGENVDILTY